MEKLKLQELSANNNKLLIVETAAIANLFIEEFEAMGKN
jgi:hypothetical protein